MGDARARDVIAKALSDRLPSDPRYNVVLVAAGVLIALAEAADGRYIVIDTARWKLGSLLAFTNGQIAWTDPEGT